MDLGLKDKVAVITGGDSGIGKATAEILLQEGAKVAILNRTKDHLEEAIESLKPYGTAFPLQADITQLDQVEAAKKKVIDEYGTVHILVHCAGITGATGDFLSIDDDGWEKTIAIDLMGAVRCCRAFIPPMRESGWGRVILLGSEDAEQPYVDDMPYCACKAGILNLAKNLSKAYGQDGVLVNSVGPAFVESPMTNAMMDQRAKEQGVSRDEAVQSFLKENRPFIELKRRGQPEEVAAVIAFLCSERSSYVLGSNWRVDGGSVATVG
ncbi:SDR family oxidoreductase [Romeria aff. gracilis LEGE 07310]|uniref:SDR family oxidoreductase n=1 Tax=Vasconcelosia minhoensis LEGE 07310 TaxID=915328 RepID=A0A8J7AYI5_9CYAN|nr:SDR family oxidoreductase [Romeria gracilis]MBE9080163.1 SDR family oxidoreductase [Romeria aff. gracilis LEGE 07310]